MSQNISLHRFYNLSQGIIFSFTLANFFVCHSVPPPNPHHSSFYSTIVQMALTCFFCSLPIVQVSHPYRAALQTDSFSNLFLLSTWVLLVTNKLILLNAASTILHFISLLRRSSLVTQLPRYLKFSISSRLINTNPNVRACLLYTSRCV